ncbi:hypothetical protein ABTP12_14805 [Acinetobacter baumannii]|nr:hypothetical protein [Acinetobacter baumannii]
MKPVQFSVHDFDFSPKKVKDFDKPKEPIKIFELFETISNYSNYKDYVYSLRKGQLLVHLNKITIDKKKKQVNLLIVLSDKDARDRSYTDFTTGKTRLTDKKTHEGDDSRLHLVFYVNSTYKTTLGIEKERGSGINPNLVRVFINNLIEYIRSNDPKLPIFYENHPSGFKNDDGTYKKLHRSIDCNIDNRFSSEILSAFKMGRINNLQLIYKETHTNTDNIPYLTRKKSQLHFDVDSQFVPNNVTEDDQIQKTIKHRLNEISEWFTTRKNVALVDQTYRIDYTDNQGYDHDVSYSPSEGLDLLFAKTFKLDPKVFKHQPWETEPKINLSLCERALVELKRS